MALGALAFRRSILPATRLFQRRIDVGVASVRNEVTTSTGALLEEPRRNRFALLKIFAVILPGITIGSNAARKGAEFLEATELFVPDEDDD